MDTGFRQQGDTRVFHSDFFVPVSEVDSFKLEDIRVKGPEVPLFDEDEGEEKGEEVDLEGGEERKSKALDGITECVRNWKAAQADSKKRTMEMFDESGWFASSCRHGLTLWVADMVRTGEQ